MYVYIHIYIISYSKSQYQKGQEVQGQRSRTFLYLEGREMRNQQKRVNENVVFWSHVF